MSENTASKSSYKKLFSNTIIFALGSFSSKVLVILLVKVYTTYLSADEMGVNDVITQIANWILPIVTLTIYEAIIRFGLDKSHDKKKVFSLGNIICLGGIAVLAIVLPIVTLSGVADKYLNGYSLLLFFYITFSSLKLVYSTCVRSLEKVKLYAINGILTTLLTLIGTAVFICGFKMGNTGYLLSIIVSDFISVVFLFVSGKLWKYIELKNFDKELFKTMLGYAIPLIPAQLLWLITNSSDSFMTTHYLGSAANGILSSSYKIPNLVATVYMMFGQAWSMSAIMENDSDDRNEFYSNVFNLNQCLLYVVAAGALMIVQPLTKVWFGPEFQSSVSYSPILIYSSVFSCFTTFLGSIYLASKQTKRSLVTSLLSGVINISLNVLLIPRIGLYGPAISTVVSYLVVFIVRAYDSRRIVPFELKIPKLVVNNVLLFVMVLINVFKNKFPDTVSIFALLLLFILITAMNFMPLWTVAKKLIPAKIMQKLSAMGTKRLVALGAAFVVLCVLIFLTKGYLLLAICAIALLGGFAVNKPIAVYSSVGLMFITLWVMFSLPVSVAVTLITMLVPLLIYRGNVDLIVTIILFDVLVFIHGGIYVAIFCLMLELLAFVIIFRKAVYKTLEKLIFKK